MPVSSHDIRVLELTVGSLGVGEELPRVGDPLVTCLLAVESDSALGLTSRNGRLCVADFRRDLPFAEHSFDLVFMHRTIDLLVERYPKLASRHAITQLAGRIRRVLVPGGAFAGCVANRTSTIRWQYPTLYSADRHRTPAMFSIGSCRTFLRRSGFEKIETFNILPTADQPLRLINTERVLSRMAFRRELQAMRPSLSSPSYVARRLVVELALNRFLEESIFFWGYKT
jgi:SAM-dependent methyltransferase